jgi:hypothetical protein
MAATAVLFREINTLAAGSAVSLTEAPVTLEAALMATDDDTVAPLAGCQT